MKPRTSITGRFVVEVIAAAAMLGFALGIASAMVARWLFE